MKIITISVSEINPAPYNPRRDLRPTDPEYQKLKRSINKYGYVDPLIYNERTKTLISGHQRLKILIEMGVTEVDVSVVNLSLEDEKALNLAMNKIQCEWEYEKLSELLEDLLQIPGFDLELTGFDAAEASKILEEGEDLCEDDDFDVEASLEMIKEPITKSGDLIVLGKHKLLCGDSSDSVIIAHLLDSRKVQLIFSDPPYRVSYRPRSSKHKKGDPRYEMIQNDNLSQADYEIWLKKALSNTIPYLSPGAPFYLWNGHRQFGPMYQMLLELGFKISNVLTWAKESFALGFCDYKNQTEFCLYGWLDGNGPHLWYGPNNETSLWEINRDSRTLYKHPTQKPVQLAYRALRNSSKRGDVVLDMFLGSGTTLIAAEKLGRLCCGMEIDPRFCDVIVRRYIALVGIENVSDEIRIKYCGEVPHAE